MGKVLSVVFAHALSISSSPGLKDAIPPAASCSVVVVSSQSLPRALSACSQLGRWEGSLFRRQSWEEEAFPRHRQKRVAEIQHHKIEESVRIESISTVCLGLTEQEDTIFLGLLSETRRCTQFVDLQRVSSPTVKEIMTTATSPILLKWDPKSLEIRTLTVERLLEPLVTQ
ncbi:Catenin alpha-2, partial [Dissostichus eleginoides]